MTLQELIDARDNARLALNRAMASLAADTPTSVPGGKANTSGNNTTDHAGTIANLRETVKFYNEEIVRASGAAGVSTSVDV